MAASRRRDPGSGDRVTTQILAGLLKRAIMARIKTLDLADPTDLGDSVQVDMVLRAEPERKAVFGGRATWTQTDVLAERNAAYQQVISFEVRVRVAEPGDDADHADREAERIVSAIVRGVAADPDLTGGQGRIVATSGDSDPVVLAPSPEPQVIVNLGVVFTATLALAGG